MKHRRRVPPRPGAPPNRKRPSAKVKAVRIKPGADPRLKKVFESIGVPRQRPFKPDPFQLEALAAVAHNDCLVTVPTGSGKTWIAVQAITERRAQGRRSWYASPLKALSNSKYKEFTDIFGASEVGILTGDRKENPDAPVIVGTTEILRNQLYDAMYRGEDIATDFVILDEAHFLGDEDRGVVWEEIMIYLPARIPLLMLSATVGNADEIAAWLASIRSRRCVVVREERRPVPLHPLLLHPTGTLLPLLARTGAGGKPKLYKKVQALADNRRAPRLAPPHQLPPFGDILRVLRKYRLLPAIFFLKSRADCDRALDRCADNLLGDSERQQALSRRIAALVDQSPHIGQHRQLAQLEHLAVGAHHSGQLPAWKLVLETLMSEGLLEAIFATSTVAAGVNFPARTVVFFNSDRFNGKAFTPLSATQFHQMTGRAGRRGMDRIGFVVAVPGKFMDLRLAARLVGAPPSPVLSQIRINFSMALNLLLSHTPSQVEDLLQRSFATYRLRVAHAAAGRRRPAARDDLGHDFARHLAFLKAHGYVSAQDRLTADGIWTSRLRVDQPLMIAEGFRLGVFPASDADLMAGIIAAFVNEQESDDRLGPQFRFNRLRRAYTHVKERLAPFAHAMAAAGFAVRPLYYRPAAAMFAWAGEQPWERVLEIAEIAEGDLAMLILRTADNLRHIRALADTFPQAAATAGRAVDRLLRAPVTDALI